MNQIIIGADSRGRGLHRYLNKESSWAEMNTIIRPGATLKTVAENVQQRIKSIDENESVSATFFVVLGAGICNLTNKIRHANGTEIVYENGALKKSLLINDLDIIYKEMNTPQIKTKVCHIPSVSLLKSRQHFFLTKKLCKSIFTDSEILEQQKSLETDISDINLHISSLNQKYKRLSVRWDRDIFTTKSKKRGYNKTYKKVSFWNYSNLPDGVHPNSILESKWFTYLFKSLDKELSLFYSNDTDSASDSDSETWDFKRVNASSL